MVEVVKERWVDISQQLEQEGVPDICLLVAVVGQPEDEVGHSSGHVQDLLHWTVKEGLELIEWSTSAQQDDLQEDWSVGGTARLAEALQAHMWPDISFNLKETTAPSPETAEAPPTSPPPVVTTTTTGTAAPAAPCYNSAEEKLLAEGLDPSKDPGGETFEQLFSRFADMKGTVAGGTLRVRVH